MLAVGYYGIYRSADSGGSWIRVAEVPTIPGAPVNALARYNDVEWVSPTTVYATNEGGGLYRSEDAGETWAPVVAPEELSYPWLGDLVVDRFHPQNVFALAKATVGADAFTEVVRSIDGGATWESSSTGLFGWQLSNLEIDPVTPNRLYLSADGGGVLAYDLQLPEPCVPSLTALCITDGRFRIESLWRDFAGHSGVGHAVPLAADTGAFWFFDRGQPGAVREGDRRRRLQQRFLDVLRGALERRVHAARDRHGDRGAARLFQSEPALREPGRHRVVPAGGGSGRAGERRRSVGCPAAAPRAPRRSARPTPACPTRRRSVFRTAASRRRSPGGDFAGRTGVGTPIVLTPDTGSFWFFDAGIHELAVKVIDGRGTNDAYWVFYGSLSNVEFELTVVDTETGDTWTRENPSGTFASGGDIEAFPQ